MRNNLTWRPQQHKRLGHLLCWPGQTLTCWQGHPIGLITAPVYTNSQKNTVSIHDCLRWDLPYAQHQCSCGSKLYEYKANLEARVYMIDGREVDLPATAFN